MKKIFNIITSISLAATCFTGCDLDLHPLNNYNEFNVIGDGGDSDTQYKTREDIQGTLTSMYNNIKNDIQEKGLQDLLSNTDARVDNSYCGSPSNQQLITLETHTQDGANTVLNRDWDYYLTQVNNANQVITYIDDIEDPALTETERNQWKAEALIWRAYSWFEMSLIFGDIPMLTDAPPAITAENVQEVYPLYYPSQTKQVDVFNYIAEDLEWAIKYAPDLNTSDKFKFSKATGNGLLARVYAEKPIRDYEKVKKYCETVEAMNLRLVDDYADLWSWNDDKTDMRARHSSESIFEVPYTKSQGNWVWMMYWRNGIGDNPSASFDWQKWNTPSRNLINHYKAQGDEIRLNQTIIFDDCGWSTYYPSDNYPFVYKYRCNASSIILMRLAEIYLLHAEALAQTGDLPGAAGYVNRVRERVNLDPLPASASSSKENMIEAILDERRLELAFEGHRWFDLIRLDKAIECVNNLNNPNSRYYDPKKPIVNKIDENKLRCPVPDEQLEKNVNLVQNPGY
ncbi:MAG: RagB/SusD family nutrient uptake outer membrane protein [Tannerellaceae bacterium]|nr:RagB/SusD family nutrient uptake outer membrane protein [Tannerellaceae bacterium]